ncbi:MAG TPA: SPOR domain-containing protein [Gemmatimonadaceae bacterium]|nr:SPOR domain-containing protein [Gemmatimonadaceae bacterium]
MRTLLALALVIAACGTSNDAGPAAGHEPSSTLAQRGPDPLVLRVPRAGGEARAFAYPIADSAVWTSTDRVPPVDQVLGFEPEAGSVVLLGTRGAPSRIDLRLGAVVTETPGRLSSLSTADGSAIFGVDPRGVVMRLTPAGTWTYAPPTPASELFPQSDGSLVVAAAVADTATRLWRMFPPDTTRIAEHVMPRDARAVHAQAGDRVYYAAEPQLIGVRSRDLAQVARVNIDGRITRMLGTPSGDRLYVLADSAREIEVYDRYRERFTRSIELPGVATDLRMDPLGRLLLARSAAGDSVWLVAVGSEQLVGGLASTWRADLPAVAPDGAIALVQGNDVVFAHDPSALSTRRFAGGARDLWYFFLWNGFRPRATGIDAPVTFSGIAPADSVEDAFVYDPIRDTTDTLGRGLIGARPDTTWFPPTGRIPGATDTSVPAPPAMIRVFTVQFAALMVEERAREMASHILVEGQRARVVPSIQSGTPVFRVVLGPYPSREDADRAGSRAGHMYWVYEGLP